MPEGIITVAYIVSAVLFILSLRGLSNQETARRGNLFGVAGMIIAVVATVLGGQVGNIGNLILVMLIGGGIGLVAARRVAMTAMPELVAILHSFVGYMVIWNVSPSLHTPLMSVTNAISGIIVIGGMIHLSGEQIILPAIAVLIASINIVGGFLVTHRMLEMFRK